MVEQFLGVTMVGFDQVKFMCLSRRLDHVIKVFLELSQFGKFGGGWIASQRAPKGTCAVDFMMYCR